MGGVGQLGGECLSACPRQPRWMESALVGGAGEGEGAGYVRVGRVAVQAQDHGPCWASSVACGPDPHAHPMPE